jgi:hypothetical protein
MKKTINSLLLLSLILPILASAETSATNRTGATVINKLENRIENREMNFNERQDRREVFASTTEVRLENRENNIERIRARIASTTASTSEKRVERLNERLQKQEEQMTRIRERLLNRELKVIDVLGKISDKIADRINILDEKGLDMTASLTKLAEADAKIDELNTVAGQLSTLISTEITEANQAQIFQEIKAVQDNIRLMARAAHALLVDTIKEITKVLPAKNATSTNN